MPERNTRQFDPCQLFPARVRKRKYTATPIQPGTGKGATDLAKGKVAIPMANNAYARTIRLHEAAHAIYSKPSTDPADYTMLGQALEDARLHLNCIKAEGTVRRDELATALRDLRGSKAQPKPLLALLALRSAAILANDAGTCSEASHSRLRPLCDSVADDYHGKVRDALASIRRDDMAAARATLAPYFEESKTGGDGDGSGASGADIFPNKPKESKPKESPVTGEKITFDRVDGKLSSDAADMMSPAVLRAIESAKMPTLTVHKLFTRDNVPTWFGEDAKHTMAGCRIHSKKLAMTVGPVAPRVFLRTIRRNGGSVLIDASGSMSLPIDALLAMLTTAPAATIGFYNAPSDSHNSGNLWVFAHKGKRAADFSGINFSRAGIFSCGSREPVPVPNYGNGNVVDFQAMQWLLAQPAPRFFLTDCEWTGCRETQLAAQNLYENAIARKKFVQATSLGHLNELLAKGRVS